MKRRPDSIVRWAARRLELRSFGLVPEHFDKAEGLRAALAVGAPLALALASDITVLGWAVFAAFWTCLCDAPAPDAVRRRILALFMGVGTVIAFAGSALAALWPMAGMVIGPIAVFAAVLASARIAYGGLLGTLLGVVAVVAVGFPQPVSLAAAQAAAFMGGAAWAYLLITLLWPIDAARPLVRASDAVIVRLLDMAESLVAQGDGPHRDGYWHSEHAEHRRTVRLAIERLRSLLDRYAGQAGMLEAHHATLAKAETLFGALIALDQGFIERVGPAHERLAVARACRTALLAWMIDRANAHCSDQPYALPWAVARLRRLVPTLREDLCAGCALALAQALAAPLPNPCTNPARDALRGPLRGPLRLRPLSRGAVQQALRQTAGLVAVYAAALAFDLGYPYWAAMAVVVVLQGGVRITWARCLERILGSVLGGILAFALLLAGDATITLAVLATALAGAAIALRAVNYTVFVVFLTMLFVIVTAMLHPGEGIVAARMVDNVIGSLAALLAVLALWPDFGASLQGRIAEGIAANRAYFEAVEAALPFAEIEAVRRAAGLASIEAETALHDLGGLINRTNGAAAHAAGLGTLRTLAGSAAMAWHRRLGQGARG
ncbi:FUSC family protein [Novosphingobium sp. SG720]|uniref:FUSC family protein n=1 Tax=Novosphingobium sp. SG720 TaxID=2586998 RepID=UPI00185473C5|nr:putative membrane protein YccC [Novosphingobium sp. SG720]